CLVHRYEQIVQREAHAQEAIAVVSGLAKAVYSIGTSDLGGFAESTLSTFNTVVAEDFAISKAQVQELMGLRDLRDKLQDCWFGYDQSRIPVASAEQAWQVANADLAREIGHTRSLRAKLDQVLVQLQAALAREGQRNRPRVAFHYWADEAVEHF